MDSLFKTPAYDLSGKVALVTGATRGIGRAIAAAFSAGGAAVIITGRKPEDCARAQSEFEANGFVCAGIAADVTKPDETERLSKEIVSRFGHIDILVNNAGIGGKEAPIFDITCEEWDQTMNTNLRGLYFCAQAVAQRMMEQGTGGRIINMASAAGIISPNYASVYGAAKAGVIHLTKIMANEWARYGINVNAIAPGYIKTDMTKDVMADEKNASAVLKKIGLRRFGEVQDITGTALFLAGDAAKYITGVLIPVDGGMTIS